LGRTISSTDASAMPAKTLGVTPDTVGAGDTQGQRAGQHDGAGEAHGQERRRAQAVVVEHAAQQRADRDRDAAADCERDPDEGWVVG
jgi:hypothetical protein